jgi:hypothetical protein
MSKLETNTIDNVSGSSTLTIGDSNTSTITLKSGATLTNFPDNTPAFEANLSSDQTSVADNTLTKVQFNSEVFDTDSCYDNSSNYRFTPTTAGKYFVYAYIVGGAGGGNADNKDMQVAIYKNGSLVKFLHNLTNTGYENEIDVTIHNTIDMNGSSDYLEIFGKINSVANSGSNKFLANECTFGAYKLIGV